MTGAELASGKCAVKTCEKPGELCARHLFEIEIALAQIPELAENLRNEIDHAGIRGMRYRGDADAIHSASTIRDPALPVPLISADDELTRTLVLIVSHVLSDRPGLTPPIGNRPADLSVWLGNLQPIWSAGISPSLSSILADFLGIVRSVRKYSAGMCVGLARLPGLPCPTCYLPTIVQHVSTGAAVCSECGLVMSEATVRAWQHVAVSEGLTG